MTVENLSGASGSISFANACEAAADGYNIYIILRNPNDVKYMIIPMLIDSKL